MTKYALGRSNAYGDFHILKIDLKDAVCGKKLEDRIITVRLNWDDVVRLKGICEACRSTLVIERLMK